MPTDLAAAERPLPAIHKIRHELELRIDDLAEVLPSGMDPRRFVKISLLAIAKNPDLLACTPTSIITSIIEAAEIGIEPTGSLNRAWLVPFKDGSVKKAQLMIGYQGYADLMRDSGKIGQIWAEAVFEGDHFKVVKGSAPRIEHEPAYGTEDPTKVEFVYAIAVFRDGTQHFEVMTRDQVEVIRSKSRQRNGPTWTQNWVQMARKTVVRRLANYVPLSERAIGAMAKDDEREYGPGPVVAATSRTADVRNQIADRIAHRDASDPAPDASAGGQQDAAPEATDAECGATSDPKLGDVEECVLDAGHANADGSPSPHESKAGTKFPNKGVQ